METSLQGDGADVRLIVLVRIGAYFITVVALTAAGLALVGGVRDAVAWVSYAVATVVGALTLGAWLLAELGHADAPRSEQDYDWAAASEGPPLASEPAGPALGRESDPDDVDYLMALRHEFRTPLNAVLGFTDVLLSGIDGEVNESQREDLEIIRASGIRLRVLLDSALDLSKLADDDLRLDADRVDVRELVTRAAAEAGQLWSNKRAARRSIPEEPCFAEVDESRLRRSVLVLADYLVTQNRDADITVTLFSSDDHFAIELVADSSDALDLDALPTIAEVLAAEDATTIRRWPVAVTSEVIAGHRGSLYHGNAPSRFRIRLPLGSKQ